MKDQNLDIGTVIAGQNLRYYFFDKNKTNLTQMYLMERDLYTKAYRLKYRNFEVYLTDFKEDGEVIWYLGLN